MSNNNYFDVAFNKDGSEHYHTIRIAARGPVRHLVGKAFGEYDHQDGMWEVWIGDNDTNRMRVKNLTAAVENMERMTAKLSAKCKETAYKQLAQTRGLEIITAAGSVFKIGNRYCLRSDLD